MVLSFAFFCGSLVFIFFLYEAFSLSRIRGRGNGFNTACWYSMDESPLMFWLLVVCYSALMILLTYYGVMAWGK